MCTPFLGEEDLYVSFIHQQGIQGLDPMAACHKSAVCGFLARSNQVQLTILYHNISDSSSHSFLDVGQCLFFPP